MAEKGWYPDPERGYPVQRYWDGAAWTEHRTFPPPPTQLSPIPKSRPPAKVEPDTSRVFLHIVALFFLFLPGVIWLIFDSKMSNGSRKRVILWYLIVLAGMFGIILVLASLEPTSTGR